MTHSGALRAGGVVVRTSDSLRLKIGQFLSLHVVSDHSAINQDLTVNEQSSRSNCCVAECFPQKSSRRWNEQFCQGMKCKAP